MTIESTTDESSTTDVAPAATAALLASLRGTSDTLSVRRVFGEPIQTDGATIIPVARVMGGGGGGAGEGPGEADTGSGFGTGFGLRATPVGVYVVRDGGVDWKPAVDVSRLAKGGQALGALVVVCATLVALRYRR
jgi:uncharacterized spore protein YtfJ